jgi:hypothetical protein
MPASNLVPAAQYVRMSTEHQHYSLENQAEAISAYAALHSFQVVGTYSDSAKSGVPPLFALFNVLKSDFLAARACKAGITPVPAKINLRRNAYPTSRAFRIVRALRKGTGQRPMENVARFLHPRHLNGNWEI